MNAEVTAYIAAASTEHGAILKVLRKLVHESVPDTVEQFKWSRPVFRATTDFAYLSTTKTYVTLGFYKASGIKDPKGLLECSGKEMRHLKLRTLAYVDGPTLKRWLKAAAGQ